MSDTDIPKDIAALQQLVEQLSRERAARELAEKRIAEARAAMLLAEKELAEAEERSRRRGQSVLTSPIPELPHAGVIFSTIPVDSQHALPIRIVERPFATLASLTYTSIPSRIFLDERPHYSAHYTVYPYVKTLLDDVAKLSGIAKQVEIVIPYLVSNFEDNIGVVRTRLTKRVVAVIEIKRPASNIDPAETTGQRSFGQLLNYMLLLRAHYSVRHVFGLLTSWDHNYVCWLPDNDDAAASDQLLPHDEKKAENENPNPGVDATNPDHNLRIGQVHDRVMHRSRCYKREEGRPLIEMLASFMKKAIESPLERMSMFNPARTYPLLTSSSDAMEWVKNVDLKDVSYMYPDTAFFAQPEVGFHLMQGYNGGRDGRVWCACTVPTEQIPQRHMVVLKVTKGDNNIAQECEDWNHCYEAAFGRRIAHTVTLSGCVTLVMTFVFTGIRLSGPDRFAANRRLDPGDASKLKEHTAVMRALRAKKAATDAMERMNDALDSLKASGLLHRDMRWRHVAELPLFHDGRDEPELLSIVIDLSGMAVADDADDLELEEHAEHLRQMQEEFNKHVAAHRSKRRRVESSEEDDEEVE